MKLALRLLLVLLLAAFAANAGAGVPAASTEPVHAAMVDQAGMDMTACDACASDQTKASMTGCGSVCLSAALAAAGVQPSPDSSVVSERFPAGDWELRGQARLPELTPPKQILS